MSRAVAVGSELRLAGYALAGVEVIGVPDAGRLAHALEDLADDVALVILDRAPDPAALAELARRPGTVWCSLPT